MIHQVTNEMEKAGDSQPSSSEPVSPTSKEMMKERQQRVLKVEAESSENCLEKIKGVLEKLRETSDIDTWREERDGTVMVWGYFDPEKLKIKLENEAGDAIMSITDPTKSVHSGRDGTVIEHLENQDVLDQPQGLPEKRVSEVVADSGKKTTESKQSRPWNRRGSRSDKLASYEYAGPDCAARIPAMFVRDVRDLEILPNGEWRRKTKEKSGCCCCIL
ncbi:uncharacterized protein LOC121983443 isoform X2 [Zingiber officinale]|uniref:uncharacterized protein LOC121983443 isoform X2 n=1 Tax=Zingiber officinale TaxID=94328 RepID=UPI001C4CA299|nr:uncharacterized protein LOC121983443 isoform X2 [Zingiber officinale]